MHGFLICGFKQPRMKNIWEKKKDGCVCTMYRLFSCHSFLNNAV